jgi:hypothetical protein
MTYDWDGRRTLRLQLIKLTVAITVGLSLPAAALYLSRVS